MEALRKLTSRQRDALTILNEASEKEPDRVPHWWRRQWQLGTATTTVLDALIRRGYVLQRLDAGHFEWRITSRGRHLFVKAEAEG